MKKIIVFLLLVFILVSSFSACISGQNNKETTASDTNDPWKKYNYDGDTFSIGWSAYFSYDEVDPISDDDEIIAGTVDEAVYKRNGLVENALNVNIKGYPIGPIERTLHSLEERVLSDDHAYEVLDASVYYQLEATMSGYLADLRKISGLNLLNKWWDQSTNEAFSFNSSKQYYMAGDINYLDDYSLTCMAFNSVLMNDAGLEKPYSLVRNGNWTMEAFLNYIKDFSRDNGDSVWDEKDIYGFLNGIGNVNSLITGFDTNFMLSKGNGVVKINDSEDMSNKIAFLMDNLFQLNDSKSIITERIEDKIGERAWEDINFTNGKYLFTGTVVGFVNKFRYEMNDDFGIVPLPKYNESQTRYSSAIGAPWDTAYSVLANLSADEQDRAGIILDCMGSFSYDTVYKSAIDTQAKIKGTRDDDTAEMIDIIFQGKLYEIGLWPTPLYSYVNTMAKNGTNVWSSLLELVSDLVEAKYADLPNYFGE